MVVQNRTIIVGAGPAGLAIGACLKRAGLPFVILEQNDRVGSVWHRHYDRLHLHTDKAHSALPFAEFPRSCPRYPSRAQVIDYLEAYARHFELAPWFNQKVTAARYNAGLWEVQTADSTFCAPNLVIATGYCRQASVPAISGQASFRGPLLHSSQYRSGEAFRGQDVLVVGFGNSGGEIAIDLWEHDARVSLAVRGPVNVIPRELFGIPLLNIAIAMSKLPPRWADALNAPVLRLAVGDLAHYGLRRLAHGPTTQVARDARIPLIDVGTIESIRRGHVRVYPGIDHFIESGVVFADHTHGNFDAVILATGYRPGLSDFLSDGAGALPGLYFCGFRVAVTGMLREISREATRICAAIAQNSAGSAYRQAA